MEVRNVQKTKDMCYLYLPSKWVKQYHLEGQSQVGITLNADGSLSIYPQAKKKKRTTLSLFTKNNQIETIHKLLVAAYISPADSFRIKLDQNLNVADILNQKNLVSLEVVEIDQGTISCESSLQVSDPLSVLMTMIRKIKNLTPFLSDGQHEELLECYEEEIDRSRLLVEKAIIAALSNPVKSEYNGLELHFISVIAKELERMADHLTAQPKLNAALGRRISVLLTQLQQLLENEAKNLTSQDALPFLDEITKAQSLAPRDMKTYDLRRIIRAFNNIGEIVIDWAVVNDLKRTSSLP